MTYLKISVIYTCAACRSATKLSDYMSDSAWFGYDIPQCWSSIWHYCSISCNCHDPCYYGHNKHAMAAVYLLQTQARKYMWGMLLNDKIWQRGWGSRQSGIAVKVWINAQKKKKILGGKVREGLVLSLPTEVKLTWTQSVGQNLAFSVQLTGSLSWTPVGMQVWWPLEQGIWKSICLGTLLNHSIHTIKYSLTYREQEPAHQDTGSHCSMGRSMLLRDILSLATSIEKLLASHYQ